MILYNDLISNAYILLLSIILVFLSLVVTSELANLIIVQVNYEKLKKSVYVNMSYEHKLLFLKTLVRKKMWFVALKLLEKNHIMKNNKTHNYFNIWGFVYYQMKEYNLAQKYYIEAIRLKNDYLIALQNLAKVYELQKNYNLAVKIYRDILNYDSSNKLAMTKLSNLLSRDSRI